MPELPTIPGRIISHDIDESEEGTTVGAAVERTGLGKGILFFDAASSPLRTFCTLKTTS